MTTREVDPIQFRGRVGTVGVASPVIDGSQRVLGKEVEQVGQQQLLMLLLVLNAELDRVECWLWQ